MLHGIKLLMKVRTLPKALANLWGSCKRTKIRKFNWYLYFYIVKLAKIDATVEKNVAGKYSIQGFPTLLYFNQGQPMDFDGARTKEFIISWLKKRISDPVT